jgi:aspartate/methionine/tyrosine aminotransferase
MLPAGGVNRFQLIKAWTKDVQEKGQSFVRLSIGQPSGPALLPLREAVAVAAMSDKEPMWEYQDNGSPGVPDFAKRFVQVHVRTDLLQLADDLASYLPIPGIKPMLGVVINAMGAWLPNRPTVKVGTMTNPGYPTPADQCQMAKNVQHFHLPMDKQLGFLFNPEQLSSLGFGEGDLVMLNFPHNPTGIVAYSEWLHSLCQYCTAQGIRIFNDGAYHILSHDSNAVTLTDVALKYGELNWAEAFSASKAGNNTGVRVGAMMGSPAFMADIAQVKGNTDSGYAAPMAAGVIELFENHEELIEGVRREYEYRLDLLISILKNCGMRLAVKPQAGFFALFDCPKQAFGQEIESAEQFNHLMIESVGRLGIVGVHFDSFIRYAVCTADIAELAPRIGDAFIAANVKY